MVNLRQAHPVADLVAGVDNGGVAPAAEHTPDGGVAQSEPDVQAIGRDVARIGEGTVAVAVDEFVGRDAVVACHVIDDLLCCHNTFLSWGYTLG